MYGRFARVIVVPITEGENLFGWLAAFNHLDDGEFGTVEANLLISIATLLGMLAAARAVRIELKKIDVF